MVTEQRGAKGDLPAGDGNQRGRLKEVFFSLETPPGPETIRLSSLRVPGRAREERTWRDCGGSCYP